jgi:hypothetical protein
MHNDDLNEVLRRMCPQGFAILRFEHGTEMLRMGARELINNPSLARNALGPKGTRALARAVGALGSATRPSASAWMSLPRGGRRGECARYSLFWAFQ